MVLPIKPPGILQPTTCLREILYAATTDDAEESFDAFVDEFSPKYEKAVECLEKDRARLTGFDENGTRTFALFMRRAGRFLMIPSM